MIKKIAGKERFHDVGEYILKYYIPKELKFILTADDVGAICGDLLPDINVADVTDEYRIIYEDLGAEKIIDKAVAPEVVKAGLAYWGDRYNWDLSDAEVNAALSMNQRLFKLEKDIQRECVNLNKILKKRIEDSDGFLTDYEIDIEIQFYLKEDDPRYEEEMYHGKIFTEIMVTSQERGKSITDEAIQKKDYSHLGSSHNWNDMRQKDDPIAKENHCWLFHCLYDHTPMPMKDMIRIGKVWADIIVRYQKEVNL